MLPAIVRDIARRIAHQPAPDVERRELAGDAIGDALEEAIPAFGEGVKRQPLDGRYWAPTREEFQRLVEHDLGDRRWYREERYDCEDFAGSLMFGCRREYGISTVGLVNDFSASHAYNVIVFADSDIAFFEPQNDQFVEPDGASDGDYQLKHAVIWL